MSRKKIVFYLLLTFASSFTFAQQTTLFTDANASFKKGLELYDKGVFGLAQVEFERTLDQLEPVNEAEAEFLRSQAELYYAKCAVRLDSPDGEKLVLDFARERDPEPIATEAILEMGNYYWNDKEYDKAIELFSRIDAYDLTKEQQSELKFKQGYALFVKKRFDQAKQAFNLIKDNENKYYYPSNYYLGMVHFFQNNYDKALESFNRVSRSKKYKPHIPYYITQIYFAQGKYDDVIAYAKDKLDDRSVKKQPEINQLLGQAYFEKGDFVSALPHLEEYASRSRRMREEDFYQLGFAQVKNGKYEDAINSLKQLNRAESKLGQSAMYMMGDAQIRTGDKEGARNAFRQASKMDFDAVTKEEALYNYAKLSYELSYDREAVSALQEIPPTSKYYAEAQTILSGIFLKTRDYARSLEIIESLPNQTPKIRETYQKVAYYQGLQLYRDGDMDQAKTFFQKSLATPLDSRTKALAIYWLGDIAHQQKQYDESISRMNQFLALAKTMSRLPDESSVHTANYTQGYNYLKKKNYNTALGHFQATIGGIRQEQSYINNVAVSSDILGDATVRAGDAYFKRNKYNEAIRFYDEAIDNKYKGFVYALYQKAIIEGLRGNVTNKIIALENVVDDYPRSEYADNALLQLGVTYQEIGKLDQATRPLKKLVGEYKESPLINQALLRLGLVAYNQGSQQTAINYYKQVFNNNPDAKESQAALTALEEIYVDDLGQPEQYFAFLETIPGYNVGNTEKEDINFKAAESQYANGKYDAAINAYTRYLQQYPNGRYSIEATYRRAESYSVLKQYSKALVDYAAVSKRGPSRYYAKSLEKAALIAYNSEQDFEQAYQLYTQLEAAATDEDTRFEAQLGAMRSAYRINNNQAVLATARKVANNPRATDAQRASASFYMGKIAFDTKDYTTALESFNQVTKLSDNEQTAEARYLIAYIYYLQRDLDLAQQLTLNANRESSNYPYWIAKSVILLSDVLVEKGDLFNARAALEGLIDNYDEDQELVNIAKTKLAQLQQQEAASSRLRPQQPGNTDSLLELEEEQ